ncbi:hypothetical protein FACS189472_14040 [Alphaproteobacteria bacterium]|nr:hypothetical protein FACS189472_14040 [Alphaproteobacteria bacterium]
MDVFQVGFFNQTDELNSYTCVGEYTVEEPIDFERLEDGTVTMNYWAINIVDLHIDRIPHLKDFLDTHDMFSEYIYFQYRDEHHDLKRVFRHSWP